MKTAEEAIPTNRYEEGTMLLEQLAAKSQEPPEYDWESYYRWYFSKLHGRDGSDHRFWSCRKCLTVNLLSLPARYGKCRCCGLIYLPDA